MCYVFDILCESCKQEHRLSLECFDPHDSYEYICPNTGIEVRFEPIACPQFVDGDADAAIRLHETD